MKEKRFQIESYKDRDTKQKSIFWVSMVIFLILMINKVEMQNWTLFILFVAMLILQVLKLFFPKVCLVQSLIVFEEKTITYQLGNFSFNPKQINVADIKHIKIFDSFIILKTK